MEAVSALRFRLALNPKRLAPGETCGMVGPTDQPMQNSLRQGLFYLRTHPPGMIWHEFIRRDNQHPLVQVSKYGFCGVLATAVHNLIFGALGWSCVLPHFAQQGHPPQLRALYFVAASAAGFLVSDVIAYVTNVLWVFQGGRHDRKKEFILFTAVAAVGFVAGLAVGTWDILHGSGSSWQASIFLVVTSTLVNFVTRKLFIFRS